MNPWSIEGVGASIDHEGQWLEIANRYSVADLTYPDKDKYLALSAIAARASEFYNDDYFAGMFSQSMVRHLCWTAGQHARRSAEWRAPSWSWLSIDGQAQCNVRERDDPRSLELAKVIDVHTELKDSENRFGPLSFASMRPRCRPLPPKIREAGGKMYADIGVAHEGNVYLDDNGETGVPAGEITIVLMLLESNVNSPMEVRKWSAVSQEDIEEVQELVYSSGTVTNSPTLRSGLILRKIDKNIFQRMGMVVGEEEWPDEARSLILDHLLEVEEQVLTVV